MPRKLPTREFVLRRSRPRGGGASRNPALGEAWPAARGKQWEVAAPSGPSLSLQVSFWLIPGFRASGLGRAAAARRGRGS